MTTIRKLFDLLSPGEQKKAVILWCMVVAMALLDVIGVASIMPFMAVLANPQLIESNLMMNYLYGALDFKSERDFLVALGLLVFLLLVISLSFKALTIYAQTRFALMREFTIGKRLVEGYLHQPYSWFLNRHSADLGKTILSEVGNLIHGGMLPLMNLIAQGAVALALMALLLYVDTQLALTVGMVLGSAYLLIFKLMSFSLKNLGEARFAANQQRFAILGDAFGAAKEVKLAGLEQTYTKRFEVPAAAYAKRQYVAQVIAQLPKFILEILAFGGMLLVMLYLLTQSGSFSNAIPIVALYAFAGYRLLPALQQIYVAMTQIRFVGPALDALHKDLKSLQAYRLESPDTYTMQLKQSIQLYKIEYTYPNAHQPALKGISLEIPVNSTVGFVGSSGSGKTTTADLILGLLEPQAGRFTIDDQEIGHANKRMWQNTIGYVPQQIYLSDDTIGANIAFGLDSKDINMELVESAAKLANLHDFVSKDLHLGYQTTVGERGIRLSGGQRQRIGIARALYHKPQVLILDEATSALDNLTEQTVMDAVHNLSHKITIIIIAHRLSTVRECDQIFLFDKGIVKSQGTFDILIESNDQFRAMAGIN